MTGDDQLLLLLPIDYETALQIRGGKVLEERSGRMFRCDCGVNAINHPSFITDKHGTRICCVTPYQRVYDNMAPRTVGVLRGAK
jgi:hypothetical protein